MVILLSVGDTLNIPDSVMGITFLAAGTSVPEAVSSVIVAKQGKSQRAIYIQYTIKTKHSNSFRYITNRRSREHGNQQFNWLEYI